MALHLTVSMRIIRAHLNQRHVAVAVARDDIVDIAKRIAAGTAGLEITALAARLEKATRCPIGELAKHAEAWPDA